MTNTHRYKQYRSWPVYALAASVPVSMAAISLSKLAVLLVALCLLLRPTRSAAAPYQWKDKSVVVVLLMLAALAFSMTYTTAPWDMAANDLAKYAKFLLIVLIPLLISTRGQARTALSFYAVAQIFVLMSSWLLAFGIALPWVSSAAHSESNTVFHLYIHQSIMTTGLAALCWHLRHELQAPWFRVLAPVLCAMALINVMFLLGGRTGYFAAVTVIVSALLWETRKQWRWLSLIVPILTVCVALVASPHFKSRAQLVITESLAYKPGDAPPGSAGLRLNYWYRSVQAIAERPLTGFGAGSWVQQYRQFDAGADSGRVGNPHQEFLLWGVLLGVGGIGLIVALLVVLWWDARNFSPPHARALRSILLILSITALFNSVLYDGVIGDYFCLMLGLLLALGKTHDAAPAISAPLVASPARIEAS